MRIGRDKPIEGSERGPSGRGWPVRDLLVRLRAATGGEAVSSRDAAVLRDVEQESERFAAWSRVAFVLLLSVALAPSVHHGIVDGPALGIVAINTGLSLGGVLLSHGFRGRGVRIWVPWLLGLCDVLFVLSYVAFFNRFQATLPGAFKPAVVVGWGAFLALALSAMRGRPWLLSAQTILFAGGLALATRMEPVEVLPDAAIYRQIVDMFGPGQNTARFTVLALTGAVLAITTQRARVNLHRAVAASRRAAALSSFMAPAVASVVADTELVALREGRQQDAAVLFADVRGFTALSEMLPPRDVALFLTDFRRRAAAAIEAEGGVVDKFIGDEVMGLFGVPAAAEDDARRAERAGRRLLAAMANWNEERVRLGQAPVRIGIGIHHGPVFVGAIGDQRLEFTVLGDTVNVARRLEQLTKATGHDLLVTEAAHRAANGGAVPADRLWKLLPEQPIPGHREPVGVFAFDTGGDRQAAAHAAE